MARFLGIVLLWGAVPFVFATGGRGADWHHPLYLDGGHHWRQRFRVTVANRSDRAAEGEPVELKVGAGPGQAPLAGAAAESIRVCTAQGVELLFTLLSPDGEPLRRGSIPAGASLILPAECAANGHAVCFVYYDNPAAGEVPDFLAGHGGLVNGDLERGEGPAPAGWRHDEPDADHRAEWSTEKPQSGRRCLKTVVADGAEPTWISTRQRGIRITPGARYGMTGWVRAENVIGYAGWYLHVGNREDPMLLAPMLKGGDGTFGWKQVTARFTAPDEAEQASLGTVLRGTGTAWFDNVRLECLDPPRLAAAAEKPQRCALRAIGAPGPWPSDGKPDHRCRHRAVVRAWNFAAREREVLVSLDAGMLRSRLGGRLDQAGLRCTLDGQRLPHSLLGDTLLMETSLPARCAATACAYFAPGDAKEERATDPAGYAALVAGKRNLLDNPSFESGTESWTATPSDAKSGVRLGIVDQQNAPRQGEKCAQMHVPHGSPEAWRGWHQRVDVEPGASYLVAAWVRCKDLQGGDLRLHLHVHKPGGGLSEHQPFRSAPGSLEGTAGWTLLSGTLTMPPDAANLSLHLTMSATGTAWHDGALIAEVAPGRVAQLEGRPVAGAEKLHLWPVNALVKVFPDEPAPDAAPRAAISLARNEREPLQLAVRGGRAWEDVRVEIDPPTGPGGAILEDVTVNVAGYVPIDHATSYYRDTSPAWHRRIPSYGPRCDGFPGLWPDPLLPRACFDLEPNTTQAVWITVGAPKGALPGEYRGRVRLTSQGRTVAECPFDTRVWDFALPDGNHLAAIYDVRFGPGGHQWGKDLQDAYPEIVRFMAERRLCPDAVRPVPAFRYEDGKATVDFEAFDRAAAWYFDELKIPFSYTPWHFYLFGWGHPPKQMFGELPYEGQPPFEEADRSRLRPEYKKAYQACLRLFWSHLKEKGWDRRFVLYISDEPFYREQPIRAQMKALCRMIHEVDPEIPIYSSTWHHVPDWDDSLDIWGIGHYGVVPVEQIARLKAQGKRIWLTTDGQMCTDTPLCAVERLLPHYCFQVGAEAYEFWGVAWTTYDPFRYGWHAYIHQSSKPGTSFHVRYPNGDGFLIYPGAAMGHRGPISSIRLEQAREGVEDYEYLYLLRALARQARAAGRDASAAEAALEQAATLVEIPNAGGRYSTSILPDPDAVFRLRKAVAEAIERLTRKD